MTSATDIITYIGVPIAVLGVTPILYTFGRASYASLRIQRALRKSHIEPRVRSRLMSGIVEVDLPVFRLQPFAPGGDNVSWPIYIAGAKWSHLNWFRSETSVICSRVQQVDELVFPEAAINFNELVNFLKERGAQFHLQGFQALMRRGRQTLIGTVLMVEGGLEGNANRPLLKIAKQGTAHESISLELPVTSYVYSSPPRVPDTDSMVFNLNPSGKSPVNQIEPTTNMPMHGYDNDENKIADKELWAVLTIGTKGITQASTIAKNMSRSPEDIQLGYLTTAHRTQRQWLVYAVLADYVHNRTRIFRFRPDYDVLYFARECVFSRVAVEWLALNGLLENPPEGPTLLKLFHGHDDESIFPNSFALPTDFYERVSPQLKERILASRTKLDKQNFQRLDRTEWDRVKGNWTEGCITLHDLRYLCLQYISHSVPKEQLVADLGLDPDVERFDIASAYHVISKAVIRGMIARRSFYLTIMQILDNAMDFQYVTQTNIPEHERLHFCYAIILLEIIGQRAAYLLAGENVEQCKETWRFVYLS